MQNVGRTTAVLALLLAAVLVLAGAAQAKHKPKPKRHGVKGVQYLIGDRDRDAEHGEGLNTAHPKPLPAAQMQQALQATGQVTPSGVLQVNVDRTDLAGKVQLVSPTDGTVPVTPAWELHASLTFQPLADGKAFTNDVTPVLTANVDNVVSAILANHLTMQAEHQHMYDFQPIVWFIHFRGVGDPVTLAQEVHNVIAATAAPLPQQAPANPTTPLDPNRLKSILHGMSATVSSDGVVSVLVPRTNVEVIDGIRVDPAANIATNIRFEPLNASGSDTAVMPDFDMVASEVNPVLSFMRSHGWDVGCLYNQETDEHPQLYFSHDFKHGDPYALAAEVRQALDLMNTK